MAGTDGVSEGTRHRVSGGRTATGRRQVASADYCAAPVVLFFGLASRSLDEVIDFYPSPEAAGRGLQDALTDEPDWRDDLCVVAIELPDPAARAMYSVN